MFPETTAPFDKGDRSMSFVHGGNSLQERVIPVLTVVHRAAAGGTTLEYRVSAKQLDDVAGMHCVEVKVAVSAQHALDFGSPKELDLALRALDADDVQVELCQARGKARICGWRRARQRRRALRALLPPDGAQRAPACGRAPSPGPVAEVEPCVLPGPLRRGGHCGVRPSEPPPPEPTPSGEPRVATSPAARLPPKPRVAREWLADDCPRAASGRCSSTSRRTARSPRSRPPPCLGGPRLPALCAGLRELHRQEGPFVVRIDEVAG
jgi:hypothetical protein